jgi:hypothetical protein
VLLNRARTFHKSGKDEDKLTLGLNNNGGQDHPVMLSPNNIGRIL